MDKTSIIYHDIFDYPLNFPDLTKWKSGKQLPITNFQFTIKNKRGYYFVKGRGRLIGQRLLRERISAKKMKIARNAAKTIVRVPTVKMIAVTGSLAMMNANKNSDIDLMIVTKKGTLWTTRLFVYLIIWLFGIQLRRPDDGKEKDKLCLNIWLDESDVVWNKADRNLYTAHEIAQIVPLVNKDDTYERFLWKNKWILNFWPSAVKIVNCKWKIENSRARLSLLEKIAYKIQLNYMKDKITREVVTPTRALFHPQDWGEIVLTRLEGLD